MVSLSPFDELRVIMVSLSNHGHVMGGGAHFSFRAAGEESGTRYACALIEAGATACYAGRGGVPVLRVARVAARQGFLACGSE